MQDGERPEDRKPRREPRPPRKVTPGYLENAALYYLQRYAATESQLRRVMMRRVDRSVKAHGTDRAEAVAWLALLVEKLRRGGLLDDSAYASMKARSLRSSGRSGRMISQKLLMKGVPADLVKSKVQEVTSEVSEEEAARIWARKKRLGCFRPEERRREEDRRRDLGAMARAGFSFAVAKRVLEGG